MSLTKIEGAWKWADQMAMDCPKLWPQKSLLQQIVAASGRLVYQVFLS